jgi:hypothetical protein
MTVLMSKPAGAELGHVSILWRVRLARRPRQRLPLHRVTGHELTVIALTILATSALLQIGYLVGCIACVYADAHLRARKAPRHRLSKSKPGVSL